MSIKNPSHTSDNVSPEIRNISQVYWDFCEKIEEFFNTLVSNVNNKKEVMSCVQIILKKEMKTFNSAYATSKQKLEKIKRDNGQRYFDHILQALDIYIDEYLHITPPSGSLSKIDIYELIKEQIDSINTIIHHDTIEDTDVIISELVKFFGKELALSVDIVSKSPFYNFVTDEKDRETLEGLQKKGFLNEKYLLSADLKLKIRLEKEEDKTNFEKLVTFGSVDFQLTEEEREAIKIYKHLKEKYKPLVNEEYYGRFESLETLTTYAEKRNTQLNSGLTQEQIEKSVKKAIYAKVCDRSDNIRNITEEWKNKPEKIQSKIKETETKLYPILQEFDKKYEENTYGKLKKIVEEEKQKLYEVLNPQTKKVKQKTQEDTNKTLQNPEKK